jgi:hypothetical protein
MKIMEFEIQIYRWSIQHLTHFYFYKQWKGIFSLSDGSNQIIEFVSLNTNDNWTHF